MASRLAVALVPLACAALATAAGAEAPSPETIFARAKDVWRARSEAPYVTYGLRERYVWRGRTHDNWWQAAYRDRDANVALHRVIVASDEAQRLRGAPIAINLHIHHGAAHADSFDTNPDADAFPILDPLIEPNASFGLLRREAKARLVGSATPLPGGAAVVPTAEPSAPPSRQPAATPSPAPLVTDRPLRELAHVEAVARDYAIGLAGAETVRGEQTYHLTLAPLRDPYVYRLRDIWVDTSSYATVQLAVEGLFEGKPYDAARWIVDYVTFGGRAYVQQIHTDEPLRFGLDRVVTNLQYDFVSYEFPASVPDMTFAHFAL